MDQKKNQQNQSQQVKPYCKHFENGEIKQAAPGHWFHSRLIGSDRIR